MPEGDVVRRTAKRLHQALAGRVLIHADLRWPSLATVDLTGRRVLEVASVGKHLLTRMDGGERGGQAATLHSHLKMEGSWHIERSPSQPQTHRWAGRRDDVRAVLANQEWTAIGYRLGLLDLVPTAHEHELVGHLGPDVLGADWDAARARENLLVRPDRPIGEALLDQRLLAGVGTIFMAESLFLRGCSPWTPIAQVGDLDALLDLVHRLMSASETGGLQSTTGDTRPGRGQWVHGRSGRPCRRCGTTIRVAGVGAPPRERVAFYCPSCQRGPGIRRR